MSTTTAAEFEKLNATGERGQLDALLGSLLDRYHFVYDRHAVTDLSIAIVTAGYRLTNEPEQPALDVFAAEVHDELVRARAKHAPVNSLHEGYSVILEELDEFWDEVRSQEPERLNRAYRELVQTAAMAQRTAEDVIARLTEAES